MSIRYTRLALLDLQEIARFTTLLADATTAALTLSHIEEAIDGLASFPERGRKGRIAGTHELVVPRTPFIVAYRISSGELQILAVIHGARKWPGIL